MKFWKLDLAEELSLGSRQKVASRALGLILLFSGNLGFSFEGKETRA